MLTRKMKDSGIEWIGEIPEDWEVIRNKYIFNKKNIKVGDKHSEYQLLSLTKKGIVEKDIEVSGGKLPASFSTYQAVETNDIVLCLFDIDVSAVFSGISKFEGMISSAYDVFSVNSNMSPDFYDYYFQLAGFNRSYIIYSKTLRKTINEDNFRSIFSIVPPLERQVKIARKLDQVVLKIENIINETQQSIEELKKYKQSLITEAVTKGLDPNVEMKDSGIEWIGKIPENWKLIQLKYIAKINGRIGYRGYTTNDIVDEGEGAITLSPSNISDLSLNFKNKTYLSWDKYYESPEIMVSNNDIIFCKTGSGYGKCGIVESLREKMTINPQLVIIRPRNIDSKYLNYVLNSLLISNQVETIVGGSTMPTISQENLLKLKVCLPKKQQKKQIVSYLDEQTSRINKLIEDKIKIIEELENYKKSLIYEYVTGKKEV